MMYFFLTTLLIAQSLVLYVSIKKNLEWMELFDGAAEDYRELLDQLQQLYKSVDRKSKMELFLDEPVTRELVDDIKGTKKAIRTAAEKISVFIEEENDE